MALGYTTRRSPYTPYSIYLRGAIGFWGSSRVSCTTVMPRCTLNPKKGTHPKSPQTCTVGPPFSFHGGLDTDKGKKHGNYCLGFRV